MFLFPILIFVIFVIFLYNYITYDHDFFKKRGIKYLRPLPLLGSNYRPAFGYETYFDFYRETYNQFKDESVFGAFDLTKPVFMVRDLELVKQITIKNFEHFVNRRIAINVDADPVGGRLLAFMHDEPWRNMRSTLSPAFTGNKMRYYFHLITECAERSMTFVEENMKGQKVFKFETYDFFTRITNDLIASTAFGIEENSLKDRTNEFYKVGRKLNDFSMAFFFKWMFFSVAPNIGKFLRLKMFDTQATNYFAAIITDALKQRKNNNFSRPDTLQIFLESDVSLKDMIGTSIQFFAAGFDTVAVLFQFMAYELAINPEIQEKLLKEVDKVKIELKGAPLTYDSVQHMTYMEMVINETLRKHPALTWIERACTKSITLKDSKGQEFKINEGDHMVMPATGFHYDEKYFPNPEKFDPERFADETYKENNSAYMAFGLGPRKCIAGRLGINEAKIFFYYFLSKYTFEVNDLTEIPMQYKKGLSFLRAANGIWLDMKPRKE